MESLLTAKTSTLVFNKDDFIVKDFYVDKFVSNCRKFSSLQTMHEDLGIYHKILCSAMIELINRDYADFLNLSSNLVGLDKSINVLSVPLDHLKDEVKTTKESLEETLNTTKTEFSDYSNAYKKKVLAHHALSVLEGLEKIPKIFCVCVDLNFLSLTYDKNPPDVLERIALDFNTVHFHLSKTLSNLRNVEGKRMALQEVAKSLKNHLENHFLESLSENDSSRLYKVLRIYALLNKESELENFFAQTVVKPYMEHHITEEKILRYGLSKVYDNVLKFINSVYYDLLQTEGTKKFDDVPTYDFVVNAVFPEIVHCFELIFSAPIQTHVYSPGNPEIFHSNYTSTILFLDCFEHFCQNEASVKRLRQHELYECFLKKFNIDVYYQIRFSEIAGKLEKCLLEGIGFLKNFKNTENDDKKSKSSKYFLNISCSLSECVSLCYEEKIFLSTLSHNFFRLNLQLLSRFYQAVCSYLKSDFGGKNSVSPVEAAAIIRDVELLITELKKLFEHKVCLKLDRDIVEVSFEQSMKLLEDIIPLASSLMIKSLTKECYAHLKQISDIPRLYRKTNREIPSKPSNYVSLIFKNLTDFIAETESILPQQSKKFCLQEVINGIIVDCVIMVKDVLTSIEKMQNSLKILKRDRTRERERIGGSSTHSPGVSDDVKIHKQLIIDLNSIEAHARDLELDIDSLKSFKELKDIMNSTKKILPQS